MANVDLGSLMQMDPMAHGFALQQLQRNKQKEEADLAQTLFNIDSAKQKLPGQLQQQQISNDQGLAQIPGIKADSMLREDKANLSRKTYDQQLDEAIEGYKFKDRQRALEELKKVGEAYGQAGAIAAGVPGPARAAFLKDRLGPYWNPAFDSMDPDALLQNLQKMGALSAAATRASQLQSQKDDRADQRNEEKIRSQERIAQIRAQVAQATRAAVSSNDPKRMEQLETQLSGAATQAAMEGDAEKAKLFGDHAEIIRQRRVASAIARRPPQAPQIDKQALGVPTMPQQVPQAPPLPVPGQAPQGGPPIQNNPAAAPSSGSPAQQRTQGPQPVKTKAEYDSLPSGTLYIDTDGKTKRKG